ncbi:MULTISPECIES: ABC transporter substrate-binding protein [Sphingobacterium]|uniref:Corrinoid ABC transporter substrate-binding protein n=1 Tax=Sphingobacterium multivorum TaxID=28454 RepID=A0A2X2JYQ5_SPHMU|nr:MULTISPECIES: ABC transporter substrate-binding protein [Sphingobacterium]QRQ62544.1 ABC transporter substrate-binding protein [Sphingobacterium multivorum]SPZ92925.1 corrinoid ABC transporter substrate-binding protein [Sphingobacterium multivorum]HAK31746.1 iron ABC transporter substrate-binding protein [Sphingobacterium sp.]
MKVNRIIPVLLLACLCLVSACQNRQAGAVSNQVKAVDSRGKEVVLAHTAQRVVVLFPSLVDEVYMLGAENSLVGIPEQVYQFEDTYKFLSKLDDRIAKKTLATPTFAGQANNVESIVSLNPDLVLTFNTDQDNISQLEDLGIPVFTFSSQDEKSIFNELTGMGALLGKKARAEEIVQFVSAEIKKMTAPKDQIQKKVYYAWSKGRVLSTSGRGSLIDMAIRLSGAANACPLEMEAPNVGAETIYKWNPDLIILWNSTLADVYNLKELAALPAVRNKQVFVMSPSFPFDPHTVKFMLFAKQIRHWCFSDYTKQQLDQDMAIAFEKLYGKAGLLQ